MGNKIKKFANKVQKLKPMKVQYSLIVPLLGIVELAMMLKFFFDSSTDGMIGAKVFFIVCALIGAGFTIWSFLWNVVSDNDKIVVKPFIGRVKEVNYDKIKKVDVHKKKKRDNMVYYSVIDMNDKVIVKIYPIMTNSGELLTRFKLVNVKLEEYKDA